MRGNELLDKMELVDAAYVEAADAEPMNVKLKKNRAVWMKWGAAAACVSLLAFGGMMADRKDDSARISLGGILREYKNTNITASELAIEWPWEYKTISEQYTTLVLNGEEFYAGRAIEASWIGDILGSYDVAGYDTYTGQEHHMTAEVYRITGISEDKIVAVKLDGGFFGFRHNGYAPPADFGEVLDDYTLEETLPLEQFTECEGYEEKGHFRLDDDAYIWEVLTACRSAAFIKDDNWIVNGRSLSFTATSEALGVYKAVFRVTEDGYVWTNIFDYAYIFQIGREAAEKIFSYAAEKGTESEPEPYMFSLAGTLTEITEEYILVDDAILCADEKDAMTFKICLDDIRISRHIEFEEITVGDVVVVYFTGNIDEKAGNVVKGACSLSRGYLSGDGISVPE